MSDRTRYLRLTDYDNRGTILKQEGRMFFRYSSGEWVRTGIGIGYFYPDAPEYECYEIISSEKAEELINAL